jgi:sulfate permease, SulP family
MKPDSNLSPLMAERGVSRIVNLFRGLRPLQRAAALRDALAGVVMAAMDIPQVLGYSKIAGMPVVTGLYSLCCRWLRLRPSARRATWWWRRTRRRLQSLPTACRARRRRRGAICCSGGHRGGADGGNSAAGAGAAAGVYRGFSFADGAGGFSYRRGISSGNLRAERDAGRARGFAPAGGAALGGASRIAAVRICPRWRCRLRCWRLCLLLRRFVPKVPGALVAVVAAIAASAAWNFAGHGIATIGPVAGGLPHLGLMGCSAFAR